jgi:hypothetical protein
MATKTKKQDEQAARERKQKIFLVVGGVAFVALAIFQGPKLWKQLHPKPAPRPVVAAATGVPGAAIAGAPASTPVTAAAIAARAPKSAQTQLAGVVIVTEQPAEAGEGQLDSFSRFSAKDPFVQQVDPDKNATGPTPTSAPSSPTPSTATSSPTIPDGIGTGSTPTGTVAPEAAIPPTMAFIKVNGKLQRVDLKGRFPSSDRAFVLRALTNAVAKIAVVGGAFNGGDATLTLKVGRKVTLVNTATGVRYVVRLVYIGSPADNVAGFSAR